MKTIKKIICLFFIGFAFVLFNVTYVNASSPISVKLEKVESNSNNLKLTLKLENSSSFTFSYGWVSGSYLYVTTDSGVYSTDICSARERIKPGTNTRSITVDGASGSIKSVKMTGLKQLNSSGLPLQSGDSFDLNVDISNYTLSDNAFAYKYNLILICAITLASIIICMVIIKKHSKIFAMGRGLQIGAVLLLIYSGVNFVLKPKLGDSDFMEVAQSYWILWVAAIILLGIGGSLTSKKKNKKNNYSYNDNLQQQMFHEQNRLFNEQVQRDMEQAQRDHQQFVDQSNQSFNDFNNNNNFPNF